MFGNVVSFTWAIMVSNLVFAHVANAQPEGAFISLLDDLEAADMWSVSDFAMENPGFRAAWAKEAVTSEGGALVLSLRPAPDESGNEFIAGEVQRVRRTHFGHYEVVMTAARGEGVISSFFTYVGPYFGDPHDEIDFEFLGRDTTKVWLNRFVDGEPLPGRWIDLGFDAAEEAHVYRFDWLPDRIVWSVDGRELMRVTEEDTVIPQGTQRIYLNIWAGGRGQSGWSGEAPPDMTAAARYHCVSYRPPGSTAPMCSSIWTARNDGDG